MSPITDERITMAVADRVATITITRPEAKNALTKNMYAAIRDAALAAGADCAVDVVVLKGSGGAFAVGGDLKEMLDALNSDPASCLIMTTSFRSRRCAHWPSRPWRASTGYASAAD